MESLPWILTYPLLNILRSYRSGSQLGLEGGRVVGVWDRRTRIDHSHRVPSTTFNRMSSCYSKLGRSTGPQSHLGDDIGIQTFWDRLCVSTCRTHHKQVHPGLLYRLWNKIHRDTWVGGRGPGFGFSPLMRSWISLCDLLSLDRGTFLRSLCLVWRSQINRWVGGGGKFECDVGCWTSTTLGWLNNVWGGGGGSRKRITYQRSAVHQDGKADKCQWKSKSKTWRFAFVVSVCVYHCQWRPPFCYSGRMGYIRIDPIILPQVHFSFSSCQFLVAWEF